ncbi:MAG: hypothetical protein JWM95_5501, partial [Gemmatimonadetes bacterium]|nr:hypothetical protein [Gemmatimonadota bacterium]
MTMGMQRNHVPEAEDEVLLKRRPSPGGVNTTTNILARIKPVHHLAEIADKDFSDGSMLVAQVRAEEDFKDLGLYKQEWDSLYIQKNADGRWSATM